MARLKSSTKAGLNTGDDFKAMMEKALMESYTFAAQNPDIVRQQDNARGETIQSIESIGRLSDQKKKR